MAERPQPNYGLKLIKNTDLPDEPKPTRDNSGAYALVIANLEKLKAKPERWGEIAFYNAKPGSEKNPGGGRKVAQKLLDGAIPLPEAEEGWGFDIEWRSAHYDGSDRKGSVVLARYSPDQEEAAVEAE